MHLCDISTEALEKELQARKAIAEPPPPDIASVYYRSRDKKLHAFGTCVTNPEEARQEVLKQLHADKEVFLEPILYVVTGGKGKTPNVPPTILPKELA